MKKIFIAFSLGLIAASAGWFAYTKHLQAKRALEACTYYSNEVVLADILVRRVENPSDETIRKTRETAIAIGRGWIEYVNQTDIHYPWVKVKDRLANEYQKATALLQEWENTASNKVFQAIGDKSPQPEP